MGQKRSFAGRRNKKILELVFFINEHPDELTADLQQYYGINLERVLSGDDASISILHLATLSTQLPQTSRTYVACNPDMAWTVDTLILSDIANSLRTLVATKLKRFKKPDFILPPSMRKEKKRKLQGIAMERDELDRILAMKRGE